MKATCENCGNEVDKNTLVELDGKWYCDDCVAICGDCEQVHLRDEMTYIDSEDKYVCENCVDDYGYCEDCETYHDTDDMHYIDSDDRWVCGECYNDHYGVCNACGYSCHRDYLYYSERDDCDYCEDCYDSNYEEENDGKTYKYHSELGRDDHSKSYRYRVGVELEREDGNFLDDLVKEDYLDTYGWVIEKDCSLDDYTGFEAVSPILPLRIGELTKEFNKKDLKELARTTYSQSCGGHITISDTKREPNEIIEDIGGYLPILYALFPKRVGNSFCYVIKKDDYKSKRGHSALNVRGNYKGGGLEIRLFDAPKDEKDLLNRFRLVKYMLQHKATTINKGLKELINSDRLRKIVKYHLDTYDISYEQFYTNIVKYTRDIESTNVSTKSVDRIATKFSKK